MDALYLIFTFRQIFTGCQVGDCLALNFPLYFRPVWLMRNILIWPGGTLPGNEICGWRGWIYPARI